MTVIVEGVDRVTADLRILGQELADPTDADRQAAEAIRAAARPPRDTGRLASSLHVLPGPGARVGSTVRYAVPVEARTRFLWRALLNSQTEWMNAYQINAQRLCDQAGGG